ncbi:MAG: SPOR domain-containing protein [Gammaproteobacteria bacterium]|nr:SPOR domain-containing protein [Gammaproteobacteria bacterium]
MTTPPTPAMPPAANLSTARPGGDYFVTPPLQQRIDLALHLIEFGRNVVVISGPQGSGKSRLLEQIERRAGGLWRLLKLDALAGNDFAQVLTRIASTAGTEFPAGADTNRQAQFLADRLRLLQQGGALLVVTIDNAQSMEAGILQQVAGFSRDFGLQSVLRLVLVADIPRESLAPHLPGLDLHAIDMPPLTRSQAGAFLAGRVQGKAAELLTATTVIDRLFAESGGWPGPLLQAISQVRPPKAPLKFPAMPNWSEIAARFRDKIPTDLGKLPRLNRQALVLTVPPLLIAAGLTVWLYRDSEQSRGDSVTLTLPPTTAPESATAASQTTGSVTIVSASDLAPKPPPVTREEPARRSLPEPGPAPEPAASPPPPVATDTAETAPPLPEPAASGTHLGEAAPATTRNIQPKAETPEQTAPNPPTRPVVASATARSVPKHDLSWLLGQPTDNYTIQLFAAHNLAAVRTMLAQSALKDAVGAQTTFQGQPWYVIFLGSYPNRAAALAAIETLPREFRQQSTPWARPVGSLKDANLGNLP